MLRTDGRVFKHPNVATRFADSEAMVLDAMTTAPDAYGLASERVRALPDVAVTAVQRSRYNVSRVPEPLRSTHLVRLADACQRADGEVLSRLRAFRMLEGHATMEAEMQQVRDLARRLHVSSTQAGALALKIVYEMIARADREAHRAKRQRTG